MSPVSPELPTSELARLRGQFELRRSLLEVVAKISTLIARSSDLSTALFEGLGMIGEAAHFSRCLLLQRRAPSSSEKEDTYTVVVEWCAPGVRSHYDCGTTTIASKDAINFIQRLRHGETFCCRIDEVAEPLRSIFERMEIRATGCAPIVVGDAVWGTLAFDDCVRDDPWDEAHIDALTAVSNTISNAIQTQHRAEELAAERERAAQERAAELAKSNAALRRGAERLAKSGDIDASLNSFLTEVVLASEASAGAAFLLTGHNPTELICRALIGPTGERLSADWFEEYRLASATNVEGVLTAILNGPVTAVSLAEPFMFRDFPKLAAWHAALGHRVAWNVPLRVGERAIGFLGLAFEHETRPTDTLRETLEAMALQVALAVEITSLSERARDAALSREREVAAQERAVELAKSNAALRRSISKLADVQDVEAALVEAISTAAEVIDSSGGALGLYLPEERGFRTIFQVIDGKRVDLEGLSYHKRLYSLDEEPIRLAWEQFQCGDGLLWCSPDSCYLSEDSRRLIHEQGFSSSMLVALKRGAECIGYLGFFSYRKDTLLASQRELLKAIADQISLMLELSRLARQSESAAVAREREASAVERASELERINALLRTSSQDLAKAKTAQEIFDVFLLRAVSVMGGSAGGLLKCLSGTSHEFVSLVQGGINVPRDQWADELILTESAAVTGLDAAGVISRVINGEQVWIPVDDTLASWAPGAAEFHRKHGNRAAVLEPFSIDGKIAGYLGIAFSRLCPPTQVQRETLKALGHQASLALELNVMHARLEETIVAREREIAAQERAAELAKANDALRRSVEQISLDQSLPSILNSFLIEAVRAIGADGGAVMLRVPDDRFSFRTTSVFDGKLMTEEQIQEHPYLGRFTEFSASNPDEMFSRLASGESVTVSVASLAASFPEAYDYHRARGDEAVWMAPLRLRKEIRGYFGIALREGCEPTQSQRETITALAQQLVLAVEITSLAEVSKRAAIAQEREAAAQERAAELDRGNQALRKGIAGLGELEDLSLFLGEMLKAAVATVGAQSGGINLIDTSAETWRVYPLLRAHGGLEPAESELTKPQPMTAGIRAIFEEIEASTTAWITAPEERMGPLYAQFHNSEGNRTIAHIPMRAGNRLIGLLGLGFAAAQVEFEKEFPLLRSLADQMTLAVEMVRLSNEAKSAAVAREQERIALEHAAELLRANEALRKGIGGLGQLEDLSQFLAEMLKAAVGTAGAHSGGVVLLDELAKTYRVYPLLRSHGGFEPPDTELTLAHPLSSEVESLLHDVGASNTAWLMTDLDHRMDPEFVRFHQIEGNQLVAHIPMRAGDRMLGMLGLGFPTRDVQFEKEFPLLRSLADQMTMAVEMVRLSDEAKSAAIAREQEKAAQEHATELTRANEALRKGVDGLVRLDDLNLFLREMLRAAVETAGAQGGAVALLNEVENTYRFAALLLRDGSFAEGDSPMLRPIKVFPDLKAYFTAMMHCPEAWPLPPEDPLHASETRAFHDAQQNRALRHIPMIVNERLIGWLGLGFAEVDPALGHAHSLLRVLADQMAMAVEMLRVSEEAKSAAIAREREHSAQQRLAELERVNHLLRESAQALAQARTPDEICELFLVQAVTAMQGTGGELLKLVLGTEHRFVALVQGTEVIPKHVWEQLPLVIQDREITAQDKYGVVARVLKGEDVWFPVDDAFADWAPESAGFHRRSGNAAIVLWPFYFGREVKGYIRIAFSHTRHLTDSQRETMKALSSQASLALELNAMTAEVEMATVAREREQAAQQRAAELEHVNHLLAQSAYALAQASTPDEICEMFLLQAVRAMRGSAGGLLEVVEGTEHRFAALVQDDEIVPRHLWEHLSIVTQNREITGQDRSGIMARLLRGEDVHLLVDEQLASWAPGSAQYHRERGNAALVLWPFYCGRTIKGNVGIAFSHTKPLTSTQRETLKALSSQAALALELNAMTVKVELAAIERERERGAQLRSIELANANKQLALRDRLLTASAKALEQLISAKDFSTGVADALRQIGETARLSRVQVLMEKTSSNGELVHELVHEWWEATLISQKTIGYVFFPNSDFQQVVDRLHCGERWWARTQDWPAAVQPTLRKLGIVWTGVVPIFVQQKYAGLVAFDQCAADRDWSEAEIDALTISAQGIGAALSQERMASQLVSERERAAQDRASELVKANHALRSSVDDLVTQTTTDGILTSLLKQAVNISGANSGSILRRVAGTEFEYVTIYADGNIRSSQEILAAGTNAEMRMASRLDSTGHFSRLAHGEARWREVEDAVLASQLVRSTSFHRAVGNRRIYDFPYQVAGQVFGYLGLAFADTQPPSETVQETIKALATQVGLALEFRRISEQVERAAISEERNKFARDLHDTLAQGFTAILMQLGAADQTGLVPADLLPYLNRIDELARTNLVEARRTVSELRTSERVRDTLRTRLVDAARRLESAYGNDIQMIVTGTERALPAAVEDELYFIAKESMTNAMNHAQATEIKTELEFTDRGVRLRVKDNGKGFTPEERDKPDHFGLRTMQERSERLKANITIISELGFGTEVLTLWEDKSKE